eukprot:2408588-Amphidinium_carterae.1
MVCCAAPVRRDDDPISDSISHCDTVTQRRLEQRWEGHFPRRWRDQFGTHRRKCQSLERNFRHAESAETARG